MKQFLTKILLILILGVFFISCNAVKRVNEDEYLLIDNKILVDEKKSKEEALTNQLLQKPNSTLFGTPFRLHIYNLAKEHPDSSFTNWLYKKPKRYDRLVNFLSKKQVNRLGTSYTNFNNWLKETGEAPVIINEAKAKRSAKRLQAYYFHNGWFNVSTDYKIVPQKNKKAKIEYSITPKKPYFIDSIGTRIASTVVDSLYNVHKNNSPIVKGEQYKTSNIESERNRLTSLFRNSGLYHFEKEFIKFDADTVNTNHKVNLNVLISDRQITEGHESYKVPFKVHKISRVNIFTDYTYKNKDNPIKDSTNYKGYHLYSYDKIRFNRKALTNAVLITPGDIFKDSDRTLTYNQINNLRTFKYPNIRYELDPKDSTQTSLIANVLLTPRKKYSANFEFDVSTSTIQNFGIGFGGSFTFRNLFHGAETLEISARGSVGSSRDATLSDSRFFNISEIGTDLKLTFPKILFPINTNNLIPKHSSPKTSLTVGISTQQNIGLDKQNASGIFSYKWTPSKAITNQFDIINAQYVRNLNTSNYFNVYNNSYSRLNSIALNLPSNQLNDAFLDDNGNLSIPRGANSFIIDALGNNPPEALTADDLFQISSINERKNRLTEDNLIFASNYTFIHNNRENIYDENFSRFRVKLELAGNVLSGIANLTSLQRNDNDRYEIFGVEFSQYAKTEIDYIKHWDLGKRKVLAFRASGGIAIPYGNANNIPFTRSFFGGGPNDNRAWVAYELGPGSSGGLNEFNEANLKIAANLEYRYNLLGSLHGAFFVDAGNIWNVLDNVEEESATFTKLDDIQEIAVGSGLGLRYDFNFFVIRFDVGFKTFNPANNEDQRWFKGYNLSKAVYNVGINYPF